MKNNTSNWGFLMTEIQTIRFHKNLGEVGENQGEEGGHPKSDAVSALPGEMEGGSTGSRYTIPKGSIWGEQEKPTWHHRGGEPLKSCSLTLSRLHYRNELPDFHIVLFRNKNQLQDFCSCCLEWSLPAPKWDLFCSSQLRLGTPFQEAEKSTTNLIKPFINHPLRES